MRTPIHYSATDIKNWDVSVQLKSGLFAPARPMSWQGLQLTRRIKAAWGVFTGKFDVLTWGDQS